MAKEADTNLLEGLKEKHGRLAAMELDGKLMAFRPFDRAQVVDVRKKVNKAPDLAIDIMINCVKFNCVHGVEHFDDLAREYPMAIAGLDGLSDTLMEMARGKPNIQVV